MQFSEPFFDMILPVFASACLGGVIGIEREWRGHWAGLRTHMLVSLGAATFTLICIPSTGNDPAQISRVLQGIATGVGFIGAGTIIKMTDRLEVKGLTTASSIWLAASIGAACALQMYALAITVTVFCVIVLGIMRRVEGWFPEKK